MKGILVLAASLVATSASAATLSTSTVGDINANAVLISDFDTLTAAPTSGTAGVSPAAGIPNVAAPVGTGNFGYVTGGNSVSYSFAGARELSFDAGSVDPYNSVTLNFIDGTSQLFGGTFGRPAGESRRLIFTAGGSKISGFTLASGQNSFEFDNVALAGVPEPTTWALMILGFGAVGGAMRRRQATTRLRFV